MEHYFNQKSKSDAKTSQNYSTVNNKSPLVRCGSNFSKKYDNKKIMGAR